MASFNVFPFYSETPEGMSTVVDRLKEMSTLVPQTALLSAIQRVVKSKHNCVHIISECPEGLPLLHYIGKCDEERICTIFSLLLVGIGELHALGMTHGCLSLFNTYYDDQREQLRITDWFLTKARGKSLCHLVDVQRIGLLVMHLLTNQDTQFDITTMDDIDGLLDGSLFDTQSNELKRSLRLCLQGAYSAQSLLALPYFREVGSGRSWRKSPLLLSSDPPDTAPSSRGAVKLWENSRLPPEDHIRPRLLGTLKSAHLRLPRLLSKNSCQQTSGFWNSSCIPLKMLQDVAYISPPQNPRTSIERQRERSIFFEALVEGGDRAAVKAASHGGIPPSMRLRVWSLLLEVNIDEAVLQWEQLDRASPHPSDHQIEVDVPRCQSRHPTLGTVLGREKLTSVLKAWVVAHPDLEYWQGLDSLCAPFVALSYDNDPLAYSMLTKLVKRYLNGMFLQRNTSKLQTQLVVFSQLLAFHDPELANHMESFQPELYAIPWFLTLFTHILPISSVYKLWDFLLIHEAVVIHHISLAFIRQLRPQLMQLDFDGMVLFFSQLKSSSAINLQLCIKDAIRYGKTTPPSLCSSGDSQERVDSRKWWQLPVQLHVLREEMSPRMSPQDFIRLQKDAAEKGRVVTVFDTRPPAEFAAVRVKHSINLKAKECQLKSLLSRKGALIVVIAPKNKENKLTNRLVKAAFPKVVTLAGGMEALKHMRAEFLVRKGK